MKTTYGVMELKTRVVLVKGSYEYCKEWIFANCKHDKTFDFWRDADHEVVSITTL